MKTEIKSSEELYKNLIVALHKAAREHEYIENDAILVESLIERGRTYTADWLSDSEFYTTFKGNMVGYYVGLCVNCLCGGMWYADAWADGGDRINKIKYDEIYDGGVWNNIFILLEMKDDTNKKDFQNFILAQYEQWVVVMKDYMKLENATEYIVKTVSAFFQLGVTLRLDILGY